MCQQAISFLQLLIVSKFVTQKICPSLNTSMAKNEDIIASNVQQ